ncbi:MAG: hypothetical protein V1866_01525 [archaeon]
MTKKKTEIPANPEELLHQHIAEYAVAIAKVFGSQDMLYRQSRSPLNPLINTENLMVTEDKKVHIGSNRPLMSKTRYEFELGNLKIEVGQAEHADSNHHLGDEGYHGPNRLVISKKTPQKVLGIPFNKFQEIYAIDYSNEIARKVCPNLDILKEVHDELAKTYFALEKLKETTTEEDLHKMPRRKLIDLIKAQESGADYKANQ